MKPAWDEGFLRWRLREEWNGPNLAWVEAARGGTDGNPDVFIPFRRFFIPVELKKWKVDKNGVAKVEARPAQRRFHLLCERNNMPTFVLVLLSDLKVALLPGSVMKSDSVLLSDYFFWQIAPSLDQFQLGLTISAYVDR